MVLTEKVDHPRVEGMKTLESVADISDETD